MLQRRVHKDIQAVILILTKRADVTIILFSIIFLPGVFIHELSHWITARILGVRTGHFSIFPKPLGKGKLQLGSVETAKTDLIRDSLIGVAPLLIGITITGYIGLEKLGAIRLFQTLQTGDIALVLTAIQSTLKYADFWLWFYLAFAISSTMFPSASDRRTWLPVLLFILVVVGFAALAGAGDWMILSMAPWLNQLLRSVALVFGISVGIHMVLLAPTWGLYFVLSKITGLKVQ